MLYRFHHSDGVLEFAKNKGHVRLVASDPEAALKATRELFGHTRDEKIKSLGSNKYLVTFKVSFDYHLSMLRSVEKAIRLLRSEEFYSGGRYLDRYIVAVIFLETCKPEFLGDRDIKEEISSLRKASVVAREVDNVISFVDWDICIYNYLELNDKEGYHSRVIRKSTV